MKKIFKNHQKYGKKLTFMNKKCIAKKMIKINPKYEKKA